MGENWGAEGEYIVISFLFQTLIHRLRVQSPDTQECALTYYASAIARLAISHTMTALQGFCTVTTHVSLHSIRHARISLGWVRGKGGYRDLR